MSTRIIQSPRPVSRTQVQDPEKVSKPRKPVEPSALTAEYLRSILHYDPETGIFTRKISTASNNKAGNVASSTNSRGYSVVCVRGRKYKSHRLAWLYMYGEWPKGQIDHVNRDKLDNRIINLRDVSPKENQQNSSKRHDNTSGHPGVFWRKQASKWRAYITSNQRRIHLGTFTTLEEAIAARKAGELKYWGVNRAD